MYAFTHAQTNTPELLKSITLENRRCPWCNGYRHRIWTRVQFLDKTDCISHSTNILGKGMNPIILPG